MNAVKKGFVGMRQITIKKVDALEKIKANREIHIADFKEAVEGYKKEVQREVAKAIVKLQGQADKIIDSNGVPQQLTPFYSALKVPQSHEDDYNTVIKMLEMEIKPEITISTEEFTCYLEDKWDWKEDFTRTTTVYKSAIAAGARRI